MATLSVDWMHTSCSRFISPGNLAAGLSFHVLSVVFCNEMFSVASMTSCLLNSYFLMQPPSCLHPLRASQMQHQLPCLHGQGSGAISNRHTQQCSIEDIPAVWSGC